MRNLLIRSEPSPGVSFCIWLLTIQRERSEGSSQGSSLVRYFLNKKKRLMTEIPKFSSDSLKSPCTTYSKKILKYVLGKKE